MKCANKYICFNLLKFLFHTVCVSHLLKAGMDWKHTNSPLILLSNVAVNWHLLTSIMLYVSVILLWSQGFSNVALKCGIVKTVFVFHTTVG